MHLAGTTKSRFVLARRFNPFSESLIRVAHTIITLIQLVQTTPSSHIKPAANTNPDALSLTMASPSSLMASLKINGNDRTKSIRSTIAPAPMGKTAVTATMAPSISLSLSESVTALPDLDMKEFTAWASSKPPPHSSYDSTAPTQKGCHPTIFSDTTPEEGNSAAFVLTSKTPSTRKHSRGFIEDVTTNNGEEKTMEEGKGQRAVMMEVRGEDVISAPQTLKQKQSPVESLRPQSLKRSRMQNINDRGISAWVRSAVSPSSSTTSPRGSPLISPAPPRSSTSNSGDSGNSVAAVLSLNSSPSSMSLKSQLQHRHGHGYTSPGLSTVSSMAAESIWASNGNTPFPGPSLPLVISPSLDGYHPLQFQRQSTASSTVAMETTATMQELDKMQSGYSSSGEHNNVERTEGEGEGLGAIGAVTMDMMSNPKMNSAVVEDDEMKNIFTGYGSVMSRLPPVPLTKDGERRPNMTHAQHTIDLTRVSEESDESSSSGDGAQRQWRDGKTQRRGEREEKAKTKEKDGRAEGKASSAKRAVHHKEKWSVDFSELFHTHNPSPTPSVLDPQELSSPSSSIPNRTLSRYSRDITISSPMSRSVSPPRKLAIASGRKGTEPYSRAPRRPTQTRYNDSDYTYPLTTAAPGALSMSSNATSGLLPKADPDQVFGSSSSAGNHTTTRATVIRRTSANKNPSPASGSPSHRTKSNLSIRVRDNWDAAGTPDPYTSNHRRSGNMGCEVTTRDLNDGLRGNSAGEDKKEKGSGASESGATTRGWRDVPVPVPFPRVVSGGHPETPLSPGNCNESTATLTNALNDNANNINFCPPRRRFQSELSSGVAARPKPRPKSYDELGARPSRMRFESMTNLGRANSTMTSASDLITRHSFGNAVRETLIVKEEGKPPTHFVSLAFLSVFLNHSLSLPPQLPLAFSHLPFFLHCP